MGGGDGGKMGQNNFNIEMVAPTKKSLRILQPFVDANDFTKVVKGETTSRGCGDWAMTRLHYSSFPRA